MISVYTPSHDPRWLNDCYDSLVSQTYQTWEWVVVLNNGAEWIPPQVDGRVKVFYSDSSNIGALKAEAIDFCTGDIFVELDHDDMLLPDALKSIEIALSEPGCGFAYSNFAQINEDGSPNYDEFSPAFGWKYTTDEQGFNVCNTMPPYPANVAYIWYAPNHVRSFTREAYEASGGYNRNMAVLDDQALMANLYMVTKFVHIPKNLYLQRIHDKNTQKDSETNAFIQTETVSIYHEIIQPMMMKWSDDLGLMKLDLGGAHNPAPGYTTVDLHDADINGDIIDVLRSMPDNSVGVIRSVDFFEHIADKITLWNEMYRVLHHGGMILSLTPSTDGRGAFQDPTHISFYNENSFWYFTQEDTMRYVPELNVNFQVSYMATLFPSDWHQKNNICYVNANLIAVKGGRDFGGLK